jgi:hypothetical protein
VDGWVCSGVPGTSSRDGVGWWRGRIYFAQDFQSADAKTPRRTEANSKTT